MSRVNLRGAEERQGSENGAAFVAAELKMLAEGPDDLFPGT